MPASELIELMTTGGDERIVLDPATGLNRYFSAPRPSSVLAYASSTVNDISAEAFEHLCRLGVGAHLGPEGYGAALEGLRTRIRSAYGLEPDVDIVFAPSGTDLEYVGLACAPAGSAGTHNVLLGADEVGSGCIHSAAGRYFARTTAVGIPAAPGEAVAGLGDTQVAMIDVPVRDDRGRARPSADIAAAMAESVLPAAAAGRHVVLHVVHGSKTGLIVPSLADIDRLRALGGERMTLVVDACQARITSPAIAEYLRRDALVFVTGSKFMGAPPFSGFALVPPRFGRDARPLPKGLATIFRRAEWPKGWPGSEQLPATANPGLLLRLEAALFELERFQRLSLQEVTRVVLAFHQAVRSEIVERSGARRVAPYPPGQRETAETHPIEMRTLSTLDLSRLGSGEATLEDAGRWQRGLLSHGIRLGQPVKCVKLRGGGWGATLRIGLSMPLVSSRASLADDVLRQAFRTDMARVRKALSIVSSQAAAA